LEPHPAKGSRPSVGVGEIYSTLFNQNSGKHRTYLKGVPVILQGIGRITYWGQELRAEVLVHTELARAQPATVILKLFKLAVRVVQHKDRIKLHLPTSCPIKPLLATVTEILYQVRPAPCNTS
jgi:hypothetical protein